jgi:hypothetical protein
MTLRALVKRFPSIMVWHLICTPVLDCCFDVQRLLWLLLVLHLVWCC